MSTDTECCGMQFILYMYLFIIYLYVNSLLLYTFGPIILEILHVVTRRLKKFLLYRFYTRVMRLQCSVFGGVRTYRFTPEGHKTYTPDSIIEITPRQ